MIRNNLHTPNWGNWELVMVYPDWKEKKKSNNIRDDADESRKLFLLTKDSGGISYSLFIEEFLFSFKMNPKKPCKCPYSSNLRFAQEIWNLDSGLLKWIL